MIVIRRLIVLLMIPLGLLTACGSDRPVYPTLAPAPAGTDIVVVTVVAPPVDQFVASNPALVGKTGHAQLIEFYSAQSEPCKAMRPIVYGLQSQYGAIIDFIYLDVDAPNTKALQKELTFTDIRPTIIFLNNKGEEVGRLLGAQPKEIVQQYLDSLVAEG